MNLPAFFGHKRSVNLLPRDAFESSTLGVVLEWALTFGKWAVIVTQLVVMITFLWRFTLDRRLTDLKKSIARDVAIVKSYEQVEREFTLTQRRVATIKPALDQQEKVRQVIDKLMMITPTDVWLDKLAITPNAATLNAYSGSLSGFGQLLTRAQSDPLFKTIVVNKVQDGGGQNAAVQFEIALGLLDKGGAKK